MATYDRDAVLDYFRSRPQQMVARALDFLNAFSLGASTPATAVIHDTHHPNGEKKHRLKGALNAESARRFIVDFLAARGGGKKDEL